jgi:large subunit ribosomal protein L24e
MPKCSFSGKDIPKGQGIMYVRKNGQVLWFMNSKCERNFLKLKRKPVNFKWSTHYKKGDAPKVAAKKTSERGEAKVEPKPEVKKKEAKEPKRNEVKQSGTKEPQQAAVKPETKEAAKEKK